ncbi:MAG: flagellar biosynthetic protein FliO [Lachnospiraceae bacterium]|nr:flagellar biosynthetic protein FliO [Lachnospiraceae bacterium]
MNISIFAGKLILLLSSAAETDKAKTLFPGSSGVVSVFKLIGLILLCVLIIAASYFTTKFVGKKQMGRYSKSNFKSLDIYRINGNKFLQIIQVGKRYFCISVTKDQVSLLAELSREDIVNWPPEASNAGFKDVLASIKGKKKDGTDTGKPASSFPVYVNEEEDEALEDIQALIDSSDEKTE